MKRKIKLVDKITSKGRKSENGVITEITVEERDLDHFEAQKKYKAQVFVDRKKRAKNGYKKHKGNNEI